MLRTLGIFDRARLMRETARQVVSEYSGRIPGDERILAHFPGVGRYTANAVLCFAFGRSVGLLDANVIRVLDRVFSIRSGRSRPRDDPALWAIAQGLVPEGKAVAYNRALLDLAAQLCKPGRPLCDQCPLAICCDYCRETQLRAS
jgi:A/G-specific adenine glycosylase